VFFQRRIKRILGTLWLSRFFSSPQVRDFSFYPDTGLVSKVMYDDFGLSFLPATFFDTFSIALSDVLSLGPTGIVVSDEAKYRERRWV
jgi:hypothetical protein